MNTAFLDWIKLYHSGAENAINAKHMKQWGSRRAIRILVHELRLEGVPICSGSSGYYYAKNSVEVSKSLSFLESMDDDLRKMIDSLKDTYYEMKHAERVGERRT